MLAVLYLWFQSTEMDTKLPVLVLLAILGPVLLVVGLRLAVFRDRSQDASPEQARAFLLGERRRLTYALYGGAALALLLALLVIYELGLAGFGQASVLVVLSLISAGAGVGLSIKPGSALSQEHVLQALLRGRPRVIAGLCAAAAVAAGIGVWQGFASGFTPEAVGGVLLALLFAGVGLWQALTPPENASAQDMRLLILVTGGGGGLIIALGAFWRTWLWWGEIFPAETPMAQSEGVWRLWLLVYIEIVALAILFGSLLLARVDIRQNAVMRRLLFGYNTFLTGLLVLATLVLLNVVVYATYPLSFEFTKTRGLYGLSDSSKNLLRSLKEDVHVYVLMSAGHPLYTEVRNLTDNLQAYTRRLQVSTISPDREAERYRRLVSKYPVVVSEREVFGRDEDAAGRGLLIVYGPDVGDKAPHAFIPVRDLYEFKHEDPRDPRGKEVLLFKGEPALMTQLRLLVNREVKPRVYFTQGNEELDLENVSTRPVLRLDLRGRPQADRRGGAGLLMERLKKDNYEVRGLLWGAPPPKKGPTGDLMVYSQKKAGAPDEVPADADVVIIAHPLTPFSKEQRAALEQYMDHGGRDKKGGKLIVLANSLPTVDGKFLDLGLEDLLRKYGVQLGQDFLMRVPKAAGQSPLAALATPPEGGRNKVAADFQRNVFPVGFDGRRGDLARSVEPAAAPGAFDVEVMLEVGEKQNGPVWGEMNVGALNNAYQYILNLEARGLLEAKQSKKPIPVAVGAKDREGRPRLAVFGDSRFASNLFVQAQAPYYDFLTSTIEWLAERPENVGIRPKESGMFHVDVEKVNAQRLMWLPLALILFMLVGLGLGMWVVRRR
jgi:hypothetical protein